MEIAAFDLQRVIPTTAIMSTSYDSTYHPERMTSNIMISNPTTASNSGLASPTNCQTSNLSETNPSAQLNLGASIYIAAVLLIPGGHVSWLYWEQNVNIYVKNSSGVEQYCGNTGNFNTYNEVYCGFIGN